MADSKEETSLVNNTVVVSEGTEDEFSVKGFKRNVFYTVLFYICCILSAGFLFLLAYWYPVKRMKFTHDRCVLKDGTILMVKQTQGGQYFLSEIKTFLFDQNSKTYDHNDYADFELIILSQDHIKYFEHMFLRYAFSPKFDHIFEISGLDCRLNVKQIYDMSHGISVGSAKQKINIHGENYINVPVKSYAVILLQLALNPFYIFQLFSVTLWYTDDYMYYASVIVFMTLFSLILGTYETKSHLTKLHNMVAKASTVKILQRIKGDVHVVTKSSHDLVPGDVLLVPPEGMHLPCDSVLLNGRCVVNESTLTGESFPTTKTAIDSMTSSANDIMAEIYSVNKHKRHTLYNGTEVLQAHFYGGETRILAVVIRTGFCTLKGRLIRLIIHPKPVHFTFFRDSMKFILCVGCLAFLGFIYSIVVFIKHGANASSIVRKSLDVFTIAVPPALPACMSVGLLYVLHRLRQSQIFCIDPERVNICGKIKLFVFDKTGTLTEDTLAVSGLVRADGKSTHVLDHSVDEIKDEQIVKGMACCHSLTIIKDQLTGDPLDMYMFNYTKWSFNEPSDESGSKFEVLAPVTVSPPSWNMPNDNITETNIDNDCEVAILKQYPFDSSLQRMSVITKEINDKNMLVFTKGSPEMIISMCNAESIPLSINAVLMDFTKTGSRVLAIASKPLPSGTKWHHIKKLQRSEIECNLNFLGLIIFENVLKPVSKEIIKTLEDSNIRTVMATGDNLYTAASVAREVNIVKSHQNTIRIEFNDDGAFKYELMQSSDVKTTSNEVDTRISLNYNSLDYAIALTGTTYQRIRKDSPNMLPRLLLSGCIFARMSPDQKTMLIEDLKEIGYGVGMCGDGANDCGALKAAHAGIALSDTEASVASPFTSKIFDISCVPQLLKEGRAALVTSFGIFKYMALYSFIQFSGVLILYSIKSNYSDFGFLYVDLILNLMLCFTMIQSRANDTLATKRPPGRLVHPLFIGGIIIQIFIQLLFQIGAFVYVKQMVWYKPPDSFKENDGQELYFVCYENTSVMIISFFQYIWMSAVCSSGKPYRVPLYLNYKYVFVFLVTTGLTILISIHPPAVIREILKLAEIPSKEFLVSLLFISLGNLFVSYAVEKILLPSRFAKRLTDRLRKKTAPKNKYKHIYKDLENDQEWPPAF